MHTPGGIGDGAGWTVKTFVKAERKPKEVISAGREGIVTIYYVSFRRLITSCPYFVCCFFANMPHLISIEVNFSDAAVIRLPCQGESPASG